jgi:hypothetical protein
MEVRHQPRGHRCPIAVGGRPRGLMVGFRDFDQNPPLIQDAPEATAIVRDADDYMEHVLERWRAGQLREVADEQLESPEYPSEWQTRYCIDAMLEHAVMHPIRHAFQLDELIKGR